jgi:uncharacterized protein YjbI with pentapeptide repeats
VQSNWTGARATGARFEEADLKFADFSGANVEGAIFANANLSNANLHDIRDSHADWSGANLVRARRTDQDRLEAENWVPRRLRDPQSH